MSGPASAVAPRSRGVPLQGRRPRPRACLQARRSSGCGANACALARARGSRTPVRRGSDRSGAASSPAAVHPSLQPVGPVGLGARQGDVSAGGGGRTRSCACDSDARRAGSAGTRRECARRHRCPSSAANQRSPGRDRRRCHDHRSDGRRLRRRPRQGRGGFRGHTDARAGDAGRIAPCVSALFILYKFPRAP